MSNEAWPVHNLATATVESMKKWDRKPADVYPTPEECTQAVFNALGIPPGTRIWEPACGNGKVSRVLRLNGLEVISTDLRHTGYGEGGVDFLTAKCPPDCKWIFTNPPFSIAEEFIRHALTMVPNVVMLLKSNYWHAGRCLALFENHRPTIEYRLTWRPAFLAAERGNNPLMDVSWCVWRGSGGPAIWRPLRKPKEYPILKPQLLASMVELEAAFAELTEALNVRT